MELSTALGVPTALFVVLMLWSIVWKGWALWIAARKNSKKWFIAILVLNTLGILDILYIFLFSKKGEESSSEEREVVVEMEVEKE